MKLLFFFGLLSILLLRWLKLFLINLITIILSLKCSLTHSRRQQGKAKFTEQWTMNIFLIYFRPETEVPSSASWALRGRLLLWPRQRENDDGWETQTGAGATPTAETTADEIPPSETHGGERSRSVSFPITKPIRRSPLYLSLI